MSSCVLRGYFSLSFFLVRARALPWSQGLLLVRFGGQGRAAGFELPANLALVVEPYGPRPNDLAEPPTNGVVAGPDPAFDALHSSFVGRRAAVAHRAGALGEKEAGGDGGAAWLVENPDGQRDPRDSGEEEDDPASWLVPAPPEKAPDSALPQLGSWTSLFELVVSADATPVEASADPAAAAAAARAAAAAAEAAEAAAAAVAWVGPEEAWPAPGNNACAAAQKLAVLDLSRCSLRGPLCRSPLGRLGATLTSLLLEGNALDGPLAGACAAQLVQLTGLEHLSLAQNQLSGPLPAALCQLHRSLRVLKLGGNRLMGPVPAEWVYFEDKLEELSLGGNAGVDALRDGWLADRLPNCLVHF
jgi:hypothetical protein